MNELDQFVLHSLNPLGYVRYGDDFVLWYNTELQARQAQTVATRFLLDELQLSINPKHDHVQLVARKLAYLGVDLWPNGRRLQRRVNKRIVQRARPTNLASYRTLIKNHQPKRYAKRFLWGSVDIIDQM
jgi:hypothetical protein